MSGLTWRLNRHRRDTLREVEKIDGSELAKLRAELAEVRAGIAEAMTLMANEIVDTKAVVAQIRVICADYLKE
jgi:hypothetical protein